MKTRLTLRPTDYNRG